MGNLEIKPLSHVPQTIPKQDLQCGINLLIEAIAIKEYCCHKEVYLVCRNV